MAKKSAPKKPEAQPRRADYVTGRPTLYRDEYCDMLVEHMKQGKSFWTFAAVIDVAWDTLTDWTHRHPEFLAAKKRGRVFEMNWWDDLHRRCAATGEGNMTGIVWAQKNKFPAHYKERAPHGKQQIQLNASMDVKQLVANMQPEQISQLVAAIEAKTLELEAGKNENS
jgi:hypothetical protein